MSRVIVSFVSFVFALVAIEIAARADVDSGPAVGEKVPELKVAAVTGALEGKEGDYAAERKGKPTVFLVLPADRFARPVARFIKTLDGKAKEAGDGVEVIAVW